MNLKKLQMDYNKFYDMLGYTNNESRIASINRTLDEIVEKMNKIIEGEHKNENQNHVQRNQMR